MAANRICPHCKASFVPARLNQLYCKHSCRQGAYMKRKFPSSEKGNQQNPFSASNIGEILSKTNPQELMGLISGFLKNPSLDGFMTDNPVNTANNQGTSSKNPSPNVNDGFANEKRNDAQIMQSAFDYPIKGLAQPVKLPAIAGGQHTLDFMVQHGLTIPIPPDGYKRELFSNWTDKDWKLSLLVNEKMLDVFEKLQKASFKDVITLTELCDCHAALVEICEGIYGVLLPDNYPFLRFIRFIATRLSVSIANAKKLHKPQLKFTIPDDIDKQMWLVTIQIRETSERKGSI